MGPLTTPRMITDPAGHWDDVRAAGGPVQWSDDHKGWIVLSHRAVSDGFRNPRFSADRVGALERAARHQPAAFGRTVELLAGWMVFRDPPAHTRLRDPVRSAFTPRRVANLAATVVALTNELLDGAVADGAIDVREDLAEPLPATVIAELLGVPASERERFRAWSDDLAEIVFATRPGTVDAEPVVAATAEFVDFFGGLVEHYRRHPADNLLTALVEESGDLSELELVGACTLLLFAGHETTTNLLTTSLGHLATDPGLLARYRDDRGLDETLVEELVRTMGPAATMVRKVAGDHEFEGRALRNHDTVYLSIAAANHDPTLFDDPGRFRPDRAPNPHLGFGWGAHHCLGAALARLETRLAIRTVVDRFPSLEAAEVTPIRGDLMGRARVRTVLAV